MNRKRVSARLVTANDVRVIVYPELAVREEGYRRLACAEVLAILGNQ